MAGVGFPVTVQRNSALWPCWTFSTEGVTVATGWAPSAATEGDTSVKLWLENWDFPEVHEEIKHEVVKRNMKPCQEYNSCAWTLYRLSCGDACDYNELLRLRERVMTSAHAPTHTLGSLDPQSRWNRWDVAGRPWHGLWAYCCLRQFGWLLDFVFNPVWSQSDRAKERPLSVAREEYEAI